MSEQKPDKAKDAAPKAAVEVDEKDLDQAAGGVLIGLLQPAAKPTESISLNYGKIETAVQPLAARRLISATVASMFQVGRMPHGMKRPG